MNKQTKLIFLILGVILFTLSLVLPGSITHALHSKKVSSAEKRLHEKELQAEKLLGEMQALKHHNDEDLQAFSQRLQDLYKNEGLSFYAFHREQLIYWSDDAVAFSNDSILYGEKLQKLGNGWYEIRKRTLDDYCYVASIQIYETYGHENKYLQPKFADAFKLGDNYNFSQSTADRNIQTKEGDFLFSVEVIRAGEIPAPFSYLFTSLFLLSIMFLLRGLEYFSTKSLTSVLAILLLLALRLCMLLFGFPESLLQLDLFGPKWYEGTFWVPSFGDLLLHGFLLLLIAYYLRKIIRTVPKIPTGILYSLPLLLYVFSAFLLHFIISLMQNAKFELNLNDLLQLNAYSYLALSFITFLLFAFFLLADAIFRRINSNSAAVKNFALAISSFLPVFIFLLIFKSYYAYYSLGFLLLTAIILGKGLRRANYSLSVSLLLLIGFSAFAALVIHLEGRKKELINREDALAEFAKEEDPIAEFLFAEIQKKLVKDSNAHALLANYWKDERTAIDYLKNKYFNTYWEKFEVNFTPCFGNDSLVIAPNNYEVHCIEFFRQRIQGEGKMVSANNLFQLNNKAGKISYLAEIPINYQGKRMYLFIEIYTRSFNNNNGYPELLLDKKEISRAIDLEEYSFAIYNNKKLINSSGGYNYSFHWNTKLPQPNKAVELQEEGYNHLMFMNSENTLFVLSRKKENFYNYLTSLSYLFTFFSLLLILFSYLIPNFPIQIRFPSSDFTGRLQLFIIGSLLTTLVLFVGSTTYFIQQQYKQKNINAITDKMRSVLIEIDHELSMQDDLGQNFHDYVTFILIKLSNVFYTDINLYRPDGTLYTSSRPEIFESGLKARRMDPQAVHHMILKHKTEFIQEEKIGGMEFLSAYKPFRNNENELVAYLNLPYFAKQNQLEKEISAFLVSTVNLYVIIFVLAILVSVFVVNQLSKPLRLIRSKIRKLRVGAANELIQWDSEDEIGSLVKEYNRMVVELGENVEQLAKSERESAWKEMAKQVAHEIKNPLTPMKLSIQHLKRAYDDDSADLDARVERTTNTLIEQIDTLAGIANEFANFANMQEVEKTDVDLIKSIETAANLYREKDKLEIEIRSNSAEAFVHAGKDHIIRIFNNLVKNAVQAIPAKKKGKIIIEILDLENVWQINIQDNGEGMNAEQQEKVFTPNFTTKTAGMGLGLAMVKTIMDSLHGKISFESEEGKGTVFYLYFPKSQ